MYDIAMHFGNVRGQEQVLNEAIRLWQPGGKADLEKAARAHVVVLGLHNWGLDANVARYPDGHPVRCVIRRRTADGTEGAVVDEMTLRINGSGYVVEP